MVKLLNYFTDNLVRVRRDAIVNVTVETVLILDAAYVANLHARGHTTRAEIETIMHLKFMGVSVLFSFCQPELNMLLFDTNYAETCSLKYLNKPYSTVL